MRVAFYKDKGLPYNYLVRFWEGGPYSHVELVLSDDTCVSSSWMDGGVREKFIVMGDDKWDFIDIPDKYHDAALEWFKANEGKGYDLIGQLRFLIEPLKGAKNKYWCGEAVAAMLGMPEPWRYGVNNLYAALKWEH